jgi:hypothetical protein
VTLQRILTYTLRSLNKVRQVLFLAGGLAITGHAILTPLMMALPMITGDFLAMSSTTDNVVPSQKPNMWRIDSLTIATVLGLVDLAFLHRGFGDRQISVGSRGRCAENTDGRDNPAQRASRLLRGS